MFYTSTAKTFPVASSSFGLKIGGFRLKDLKRNAFVNHNFNEKQSGANTTLHFQLQK